MKKPGSACKSVAVMLITIAAIILIASIIIVVGKIEEFPYYRMVSNSMITIVVGTICLGIFAMILYALGDLLVIMNQQKNYIGMLVLQQLQKEGSEIPANLQNDIELSNE